MVTVGYTKAAIQRIALVVLGMESTMDFLRERIHFLVLCDEFDAPLLEIVAFCLKVMRY